MRKIIVLNYFQLMNGCGIEMESTGEGSPGAQLCAGLGMESPNKT